MDIILYNIGAAILLLIIGYLIGSIPNAIWIGKVFFNKDPRNFGSGNAGATNAGRVFGKKIGLLIIFLDAFKVIIPLYLSWYLLCYVIQFNGKPVCSTVEAKYLLCETGYLFNWPIYWLVALGCFIGHCLPIFANFKGGKNVSSFYGLTIGSSWFVGFLPGIAFMSILKIKKYVSLSSIISSWVAVVASWIWAILLETKVITGANAWFITYGPCLDCNFVFAIIVTFGSLILTFFHRENIKRLITKSERKITWMK